MRSESFSWVLTNAYAVKVQKMNLLVQFTFVFYHSFCTLMFLHIHCWIHFYFYFASLGRGSRREHRGRGQTKGTLWRFSEKVVQNINRNSELFNFQLTYFSSRSAQINQHLSCGLQKLLSRRHSDQVNFHPLLSRPDICHFFSTNILLGSIFLHMKVGKLWQKFRDKTAWITDLATKRQKLQ